MDDYIPHPAKNFTPRKNAPNSALEGRTAALAPIDVADKDALRTMAMRELVAIVQRNGGDIRGIAAVRELLDRVDGKPQQSIIQSGGVTNSVNVNFAIEFVKPKSLVIEHDDPIS